MKVDVHLHASVAPAEVEARLKRALGVARERVHADSRRSERALAPPAGAAPAGEDACLLDVFGQLRLGIVELDDRLARAFMRALSEQDDVREVAESVVEDG